LNPLTYPIEEVRAALVLGAWPHWWGFAVYCVFASIAALAGLWVFQKTRSAFADVV
jgi:lipopolysaccharide transport system permease protein